jgi:hypothetical protein
VPTFVDRGRHVANVTGPYGCILGFLERTTEEVLRRNSRGSGLENREYGREDPLH